MAGPGRVNTPTTTALSLTPAMPNASTISAKPPPALAHIARVPVKAAPTTMFIAAISSSVCFTTTPASRSCAAMKCNSDDAGVMG